MAWSVLTLILLHSLLEYPLWHGPFQMAFGLGICLLRSPSNPFRMTHEVDRLAHLADRIAPGFESFLDHQGTEFGPLFFMLVGGAAQDGGMLHHIHFTTFFIANNAYL